jgi:excisionase family DNA binding protein
MFLDIDSERPSGIAATRDERNEATALAGHIRAALSGIGFGKPVCFDSGNGAYLLYRIDLPNDPESDVLIKRCLQALAHLYNRPGKAHVDMSVYNASRIMRLPGTMNCKGDETDDRKYRLCELILMPDSLDIVPVGLLEQLASMGPKPPQPTRIAAPSGTGNAHGNGTDAYGKKALAGVLADLRAAPVGERNIALNRYSFRLAQLVAGDRLSEAEATSDLEQAARDTGLPSDEIKRTIRSGWEAGLKVPDYGSPPSYSRNGHNPGARVDHEITGVKSVKSVKRSTEWPDPPDDAAFAGLAGRFVELAEQYTEADRVALLVSFLTAFGCAVGKGPHAMVGATRHDARLFTALVGKSAKARKGDSWMPSRVTFDRADPIFTGTRIQGGIARRPAMKSDNLPAVLTVEEAARFLRIGRSAAYELCRTNGIPHVRIGKLIRIPRAALLEWLEQPGQSETAGHLSKGQPAASSVNTDTGGPSWRL